MRHSSKGWLFLLILWLKGIIIDNREGAVNVKEYGEVIETRDNTAVVRVVKNSACSKCDKDCALAGDSHEIKEMSIEVDNPIGAKKGKRVILEMGEKPLMLSALIIYVLPLIGLIGGYFAVNWIVSSLGYKPSEVIGIFGSMTCLFISFLFIRIIDARLKTLKVFHPKITRIIE